MDNRQFDVLVRRLEPQADAAPRVYNLRVAALAALGYAYIGTVVVVLLGLAIGSAWLIWTDHELRDIRLAFYPILFAGLAWAVLRTLYVRLEPPQGRRLTRDDAPVLFDEAERLRVALDAPRAHVVLLTEDFNASVTQVPRVGVLGLYRNYLVVGLPLLQALPAKDVQAVLAHEFAHLSHAHGRFGNWIYRVRATWQRLAAGRGGRRGGFFLVFRWFFDWYAPLFNAYSFVLIRRHEYEADRLAAKVVGPRQAAQALVDTSVRGAWLSRRFWHEIARESHVREEPPADVFERLGAAARTALGDADAAAALDTALKRRTDTDDTHPALRDRVAALSGVPAGERRWADGTALVPTTGFATSGSEHYLGRGRAALVHEMSAQWQQLTREEWTQRRERTREAREELAALHAKADGEGATVDERFRIAQLVEQLEGREAAFAQLTALHADAPDHLPIGYGLGRLLLDRGDASGIALVERAMDGDDDAIVPGCEVIYDFLVREGRLEEADVYRERATRRHVVLNEAREERSQITAKDRYEPVELRPEILDPLVAQLDAIDGVGRAWIARKIVRHYSDESPVYVMIVTPRRKWGRYFFYALGAQYGTVAIVQQDEEQRAAKIAAQLTVPEDLVVFALAVDAAALKPMKKVKGALVYDARKRKAERAAARSAPASEIAKAA